MTTFISFLLSLIFAFIAGMLITMSVIKVSSKDLWPEIIKRIDDYVEEKKAER